MPYGFSIYVADIISIHYGSFRPWGRQILNQRPIKFCNEKLKNKIDLKKKRKQILAVSGHIIFHFKMNLTLVETFVEKYICFTKKMRMKKEKKLIY